MGKRVREGLSLFTPCKATAVAMVMAFCLLCEKSPGLLQTGAEHKLNRLSFFFFQNHANICIKDNAPWKSFACVVYSVDFEYVNNGFLIVSPWNFTIMFVESSPLKKVFLQCNNP